MSWRAVEGARTYEVFVNDRWVESTSATSTRFPLAELAVDDLVNIEATDDDAPTPLERVIGTMTFVISEFALGTAPPPLPPVGPVPRGGSLEGAAGTRPVGTAAAPNDTHFRFKTFIPEQYVSAPAICNGGGGFTNDRFFGGDNRSWSATSTKYRTLADVDLYWVSADTTSRYVGMSRLYRRNGNGTYTLLGRKTASQTGITFYGPNTYQGSRKNFIVYHSVGNPFCPPGIGVIDYNVSVVVDRIAGYNGFQAWGAHDRAPNYEFYYRDNTIGWRRFRAWNHGSFICLSACTQTSFSVVR